MLCIVSGCTSYATRNAETYYRQGRELREADEPAAAMEAFIAATQVHSHEYTFKGRSYSNMATMCRIGERHELAYALYHKSATEFLRANDTLAYTYALNNMAWEQAVLGEKEIAMALIDSAIHIYPDESVLVKTTESRAAACLYAEEYDSVLYYAQKVPMKSVYFNILQAQAWSLLGNCDSALFYARMVTEQTDNGRYLDDVYYILTHCDSSASADEIRALAATRTDIQRNLERNRTDWAQAMLIAEEAIRSPESTGNRTKTVFVWSISLLLVCLAVYYSAWRWKNKRVADVESILQAGRETELEQQCKILRKCTQLRTELQWYDYQQFCAVCNTRLSGIADKLTQKGLSEREIRICVLVMIGLSYAEIADILYRAESGIGKDKYMIAKRLGVRVKDLQTTLRAIACTKENA